MAKTAVKIAALAAIGLALAPAIARADVRIEEQGTTLDSKVKRWISIQGDKRLLVTRAEPTGHAYNAGAQYGAYVEIARPDKELIWSVDPQERSYREVPAQEFLRLLQKGIQPPRNPNDQPLRTLYRSQTTAIEVVPTGKERTIAGYRTEQVMARVVVGAQNQVSGNQFTFSFDQELWITKDERLVKEIQGFESAYFDQFGTAASLQQAQLMAGGWNDAFITHLRAVNDRVRALGGVPLSITTTVTEEAVAQAKNEKTTARKLTVGSMEVKKISLDSVPASEFELPAGFINEDTKVAVASPIGTPMVPVKPEVKPEMPAVAAVPQPEMPVVVAKPPMPEMPAVTPVPVKPVVVAEGPVIPQVKPGTSVLTAPPTNVVVRGADGNLPPRGKTTASGKSQPVFVPAYGPAPTDNIPVLGGLSGTTRTPPPPVVVDEPDYRPTKRKKQKVL
jgi:hypothetical protein